MGEAEGVDQDLVGEVRDQAIVPLEKDPEVPIFDVGVKG